MVNPRTVNAGIIVPLTGADVDLWGANDVNPNMVAIDGLFCGLQTLALGGVSITLTAPVGFAATPSPGPTQAQNAILRLTGALTANISVTLPFPGYYIVQNQTTGNFTVAMRAINAGGGAAIACVDQGEAQHIFNDGTNTYFANLGRIGSIEMWAGLSGMPSWVANSSPQPYLLCDGSVYNFSAYPNLGKRLGGIFGGNGITTFGVPDLRGRIPLPFDSTGARITAALSGLSGNVLGAALDQQVVGLTPTQIPNITSNVNGVSAAKNYLTSPVTGYGITAFSANAGSQVWQAFSSGASIIVESTVVITGTATSNNTSGGSPGAGHNNVQPSLMTGIAVIRAG